MQHLNKYPPSRTRQIVGVNALLAFFLFACSFSAAATPAAQPDLISWTKVESPLFPTSWPPTADTVWVRYTFAYGSNPSQLMDGTYVTYPLAKTEWQGGKSTTTELSSDMTQAAVQGVMPLDDGSRLILENEKKVSEYCLQLAALPDLSSPEAKEFLDYYHTWFKYNDAFLGLISKDHTTFIEWIGQN